MRNKDNLRGWLVIVFLMLTISIIWLIFLSVVNKSLLPRFTTFGAHNVTEEYYFTDHIDLPKYVSDSSGIISVTLKNNSEDVKRHAVNLLLITDENTYRMSESIINTDPREISSVKLPYKLPEFIVNRNLRSKLVITIDNMPALHLWLESDIFTAKRAGEV